MLIGLGMLGACGEGDERRRNAQNDNAADVAMNVEGSNGGAANLSLDLPDIKAQIRLPKIKLKTGDVDIDGVRLYPGSRVTGIDLAGEEGQSEGSVGIRFDIDAKPDEVRDYFVDAFKQKGVAVTVQDYRISGRDHDGKPFSIVVEEQGEGARGVLKLGNKGR